MRNKFNFLSIVLMFAFLGNASLSYSQNGKNYSLFLHSDMTSFHNNSVIKNALEDALILNINKDELKSLCESRYPEILLNVPVAGNRTEKLELKRFDVLAPDAKIVARTAAGNEEVKINDLAVVYTGTLQNDRNTFAVFTFSKDNAVGMISYKHDNLVVGALKDNSGNQTEDYILYRESDLKVKNAFHCEADDYISKSEMDKMRNVIMSKMKDASATDLYTVEVAVEMDFATYNFYNQSITNASNYAIANLAAVSAIYMKEVNTKLIVPYIRVWTTNDPYTGTTSGTLLNQFRSEWNANMQSVNRTVAHFISKRSNNLGGVAWLNALCSNFSSGFGYAFSNTLGGIAQLPNYSYEILVVAHELGHNFGSLHTFNCSWVGGPIDTCSTVEGGCYSGPLRATVGTIMSYCFNNGSVSFVLGFGPQPRAVIRNGAEFAGCTYVYSREVQVAFPNGGEVVRTGTTVPIYWGTSLTDFVNIELSTNNGSSWTTIQNNVSATTRTYNWTIPDLATVDQAKIRILSSSNSNIGDTSDAVFKIVLNLNTFNVVSPPINTRIEVNAQNTGTQRFDWQKSTGNTSATYNLKIRRLGTNVDYSYQADNNGHDSAATVRKSWLDSLAATLGTSGDSVRCIWRVWAYNGYDSIQSFNTMLVTLVRTSVGINILSSSVPEKFNLYNNYPNPFNPVTKIKFDIAKTQNVKLKVFDMLGKEVASLVNQQLTPGTYSVDFDAMNFSSGMYFYRFETNGFLDTKRMILLK